MRELDKVFVCAAWFEDCSVDWNALGSLGTIAAVVVALAIALKATFDTRIKNNVRAGAYAGELAISTGMLALDFALAIKLVSGNSGYPIRDVDARLANVVWGMSFDALERASLHAEIFDRRFAVAIGSLLGDVRALRTHVSPVLDRPNDHTEGRVARDSMGLLNDAIARTLFIHDHAWKLAGIPTTTPVRESFERLRDFLVTQAAAKQAKQGSE